jgi:hypothetical protein
MIIGMSIPAFTLLHVVITLVAIGSGLVVVGGILGSRALPLTTALFLLTTVLTSVTGFMFPINGFTPALAVGGISCALLAVAIERAGADPVGATVPDRSGCGIGDLHPDRNRRRR